MKRKSLVIFALVALLCVPLFIVERRCGYIDKLYVTEQAFLWIDDDGHPDGMRRAMEICNTLNIRCAFAIPLAQYNEHKEFYDSCRQAGYTLLNHSLHHAKYAEPTSKTYDKTRLASDLDSSVLLAERYGFKSDILVYPGDCGKDFSSRAIAGDRFKVCISGSFLPTDYYIAPRSHRVPRYFLDKRKGFDDFKRHIDKCRAHNIPVILGSHSYNDEEWDSAYAMCCLDYVISTTIWHRL